jgi:hypothetical protein
MPAGSHAIHGFKFKAYTAASRHEFGGQKSSRASPLSIGDHREIRGFYDWAEVVEIDERELLIIRDALPGTELQPSVGDGNAELGLGSTRS